MYWRIVRCSYHTSYTRDEAVFMAYATSVNLRENVVVEEQLYTEQYWQNNRDNILQSTKGIYQWILLNI